MAMSRQARADAGSWIREVTARDPVVARFLPELQRMAATDAPALLVGEPGTGRELMARAIHNLSARASGPFVVVDCVDPSGQLLEAELLGVDTSERPRKLGAFEQAAGGTLYLAGVADLSAAVQEDLVRLIQRRETMRLYAHHVIRADVRCLASASGDLEARVHAGAFRVDLFALLSAHTLRLPPLRDRPDDVPALATAILAACRPDGGPSGFSPDAAAALRAYPWPGNVHELRTVVEDVAVRVRGTTVEVDDLPSGVRQRALPGASLRHLEEAEVRRAMAATGGNQLEAARQLGLTRWALARRLRKYGLRPAPARRR